MATNQEKIDYLLSIKPEDTGPTNEQKRAYLAQQQAKQQAQQQPRPAQASIRAEQPQQPQAALGVPVPPPSLFAAELQAQQAQQQQPRVMPIVPQEDIPSDANGEEVSPSKNLNVNIYTALARAGIFAADQLKDADKVLLSKWQGEIASMPMAAKGASLAAKLPIGHPVLKVLAIAAGSAAGAGIGAVLGEMGEDVYNGTPVDYNKALEAGATTATWDAAGGLILKGIGTLSSKALRSAGIESTADATKAARELLQRYGTDLSWFQATGSTLSQLVEGIAVVGLGGRKILDDAFKGREAALKQELDTFLSPTTPALFGKNLTNIVEESNKTLRETFNPQYARIYEQGKDIPVYALDYNKKIQKQISARHGAEKVATAKEPNGLINNAQSVLTNLKQITNVGELSETIKKLNFIKRQAEDLSKTKEGKETGSSAAAYIGKEIGELRAMLGDSAKDLKPELQKELQFLDLTYARQKDMLHSKTMKRVMAEKPSEMGAYVQENPEAAKDFMRFLGAARQQGVLTKAGHKKALDEYRTGYVKSLLKTEGDGTNVPEMAALASKLRGTKELAKLKAVLGEPQSERLLTVLKTADIVKDHEAGMFGLMMASNTSKAAQGAAALSMGGVTALGALLIAPQALARAAGSARTLGQWLSLTRLYKKTSKEGDRAAMAMVSKRILEWTNADEEDVPARTSARQVPQQRPTAPSPAPQAGMITGM